jgi:hypothetical protein
VSESLLPDFSSSADHLNMSLKGAPVWGACRPVLGHLLSLCQPQCAFWNKFFDVFDDEIDGIFLDSGNPSGLVKLAF